MSPRNQKPASRLDRNLAAYATIAGAALTAAAIHNADATIIYSGIVNINIPSTTAGVYINVVTGVTSITPAAVPGWDINPWSSTGLNIWANNSASPNDGILSNYTGGTSNTLVDNLPYFTIIDSSWTYSRTSGIETTGPTAFVLNSDQNNIGFRFLNESTGQYNFGVANIALSSGYATQPRTLVWYAYEDSGGPFPGIVPEPSTTALLSLMAVGALGVRIWRGRKSKPLD